MATRDATVVGELRPEEHTGLLGRLCFVVRTLSVVSSDLVGVFHAVVVVVPEGPTQEVVFDAFHQQFVSPR